VRDRRSLNLAHLPWRGFAQQFCNRAQRRGARERNNNRSAGYHWIEYDYEHAHEHDELNWRANPPPGKRGDVARQFVDCSLEASSPTLAPPCINSRGHIRESRWPPEPRHCVIAPTPCCGRASASRCIFLISASVGRSNCPPFCIIRRA